MVHSCSVMTAVLQMAVPKREISLLAITACAIMVTLAMAALAYLWKVWKEEIGLHFVTVFSRNYFSNYHLN